MSQKFFLQLAGVLLLGLIVAGCGVKARVDIHVEPVVIGEEYVVDPQTGAMTFEQEGVRITVKPLDAADLLEVTDDEDINPYIDVSFWRYVQPLYTVFDVNIHNTRDSRVVVDSHAVLIDENGEQYASLPYEYFKDVYSAAEREYTDVVRYPYRRPYYYGYRPYRYGYSYPYRNAYQPRYVRRVSNEMAQYYRLVARETVFDSAKLFSGAKRGGLLVFEKLGEDATDMRLIIPEVVIYNGKRKHKVNFEFHFRQRVSVKE